MGKYRQPSTSNTDNRVMGRSSSQPSTNNTDNRAARGDAVTDAKLDLEIASDMQTPFDFLSSLPLIGKFFEPFTNKASRDTAIAQTEWEMAYNSAEAEKNRQFQTSERESTQDYNYKMWQEQNEYNSLASRLARAKEAGVNPNAILGEGDTSAQAPASSSPMSGSTASYSSSLANSMYNNAQNVAKTRAEVENISADTENKKYELDWNKRTEQARHDIYVNQAYDYKASGDLKGKEMQIADAMYELTAQKQAVEILTMLGDLNQMRLENLNLIQNIRYVGKQIKYVEQQTDNLVDEGEILAKENQLKQYMIEYSRVTGLPYGTDEFNTAFYMHCKGEDSKYIKTRMMMSSVGMATDAVNGIFNGLSDDNNPVIPIGGPSNYNNDSKKKKNNSKKRNKSSRKNKNKFFSAISILDDLFLQQPVVQTTPSPTKQEGVVYYDGPMKQKPLVVPFASAPAKVFSPVFVKAGRKFIKAFR